MLLCLHVALHLLENGARVVAILPALEESLEFDWLLALLDHVDFAATSATNRVTTGDSEC